MTVKNTKKVTGAVPSACADLSTHFGSLDLSKSTSAMPDPDACLAHLRLLTAFEKLRSRIGLQDGIWDIWDKRAASADNSLDVLVKLREKRWAIFVARAVDRYEAWWDCFADEMLDEDDMTPGESEPARYGRFTEGKPLTWKASMLPPIDVLLAWHAHMLNPRLYLEDCIRYGSGPLWASGIPWNLVNAAIGDDFKYSVTKEHKASWTKQTGRDWDNAADPADKEARCPSCASKLRIPWTTCGLPQDYNGDRRPGLAGEGYGDGQLEHPCAKCGFILSHDSLRLDRFRRDAQALIEDDTVLPGTVLDLETGLPKGITKKTDGRLFPSQLIQRGLLAKVTDKPKPASSRASMNTVRDLIEGLGDVNAMPLAGRIYTTNMLSRYRQNSTFAAVDLCGAIIRQGVFSAKMIQIDWLHSPTSRATMERLLVKYSRFIAIQAAHPDETAVPTLDVDLAWHTHQLSPKSYLAYTVGKAQSFIDHNDKVDEDMLSIAFEWTCRVYMKSYGEPYSECTCWYCDSIRSMGSTGLSELVQSSKEQKALEARATQPPRSAHISAHASVHINEPSETAASTRPLRMSHQNRLLEAHSDIQKRLSKASAGKGKPSTTGQRGDDEVDFWGKAVQVESPVASALAAATTPVMYAAPPGTIETGPGSLGSCAAGACGCSSEVLGICTTRVTGD